MRKYERNGKRERVNGSEETAEKRKCAGGVRR